MKYSTNDLIDMAVNGTGPRNRNKSKKGRYESYSTFQGKPAKVVESDVGNSNRIDVYYGGKNEPDGDGHSHVGIVKDNVRYLREGDQVEIDEGKGIQ